MEKEKTHPGCLHAVENHKKMHSIHKQNTTRQPVKNEQIKRKQTCSAIFVKVLKSQDNKLKIVQNNF